jgi:hypothetical protein
VVYEAKASVLDVVRNSRLITDVVELESRGDE